MLLNLAPSMNSFRTRRGKPTPFLVHLPAAKSQGSEMSVRIASSLPDDGGGARPGPAEVTMLLDAAAAGDQRASEELLPLVYDELHRLAEHHMRREPAGHTLQPTALVHEAYMRLVGGGDVKWDNRGHFFGAAARAMRRILVERARHRNRIKRGGGRQRVELTDDAMAVEPPTTDLLNLDVALDALEAYDKRKAEVVMLRYFAGLSIEQTAAALGLSAGTVKNDWTFARAWLHRKIAETQPSAAGPET